jgi:hypothetical protein
MSVIPAVVSFCLQIPAVVVRYNVLLQDYKATAAVANYAALSNTSLG